MKEFLTKVKDYFTANNCRKIFFFGLLCGIIFFIINIWVGVTALNVLAVLCFAVAMLASMVETMQARTAFLRKMKEMQREHLQEIYNQQQAGVDVPVTPTFNDKELKYLKRKKRGYFGLIMLKLILTIVLFSLLLI